MVAEPEDRRPLRRVVAADAFEDARPVVEAVRADMDARVVPVDEVTVHPDLRGRLHAEELYPAVATTSAPRAPARVWRSLGASTAMCRLEPAPIQTCWCWSSVRSIRTATSGSPREGRDRARIEAGRLDDLFGTCHPHLARAHLRRDLAARRRGGRRERARARTRRRRRARASSRSARAGSRPRAPPPPRSAFPAGTPGSSRRSPRRAAPRRRARRAQATRALCSYASNARVTATPRSISAPSSVSDKFDGSKCSGDVEDVEPADVADAEDLSFQAALSGRERDAVAVAQVAKELGAVDAVGHAGDGDDGRRILVGGEELDSHRLETGPRCTTEAHVTLERSLEAGVEEHSQCDVEPADQRDGRRECSVEHLLRLARASPVEIEAPRRQAASPRGARRHSPSRAPAGTSAPSASRRRRRRSPMRPCRAAPHRVTRSRRRRALASPIAAFSPCTSATTPVEVSDCVQKTIRAPLSATAAPTSSGTGTSPHS